MADTRFQTQVRNQSGAEIDQGLRAYMVKVYNYMAAGLGITAVAAVLTFMAAVDGHAEFVLHAQLKPGETEDGIDDAKAIGLFHAAAGYPVPATVLTRGGWTAGYAREF